MKLKATINLMLHMCPEAWRVFLRALQLCCCLLLCSVFLLYAWDADHVHAWRFLQLSAALQEMAQLALLAAVIVPPCIEDRRGQAR